LSGANLEYKILPLDITKVTQRGLEDLVWIRTRTSSQPSDTPLIQPSLRLGGERRKSEGESENDDEPDQPHGHLVEDGWRRNIIAPARSAHSPRRTGIVNVNVEPMPTWLVTPILPPWSSMNFRQSVSPSPVPSAFLSAVPTWRNSSNTAS
jgi:hypothetical protein